MTEALVIASRDGAVGPALIEAASTAFNQSYLRPLGQYTSNEAQQELTRGRDRNCDFNPVMVALITETSTPITEIQLERDQVWYGGRKFVI
jgi:hypothetical protein